MDFQPSPPLVEAIARISARIDANRSSIDDLVERIIQSLY